MQTVARFAASMPHTSTLLAPRQMVLDEMARNGVHEGWLGLAVGTLLKLEPESRNFNGGVAAMLTLTDVYGDVAQVK